MCQQDEDSGKERMAEYENTTLTTWPHKGACDNNLVTTRRVSPQFTFLFSPFYKYGACSSAQDGGYLNVGTFNNQVDPTKGINLVIHGDNDLHENY